MTMPRRRILFLTSHDVDASTCARVRGELPVDIPEVDVITVVAASDETRHDAIVARASQAGVLMIRLMGGKESLPGVFERVIAACEANCTPIAQRSYPMANDDLAPYTTVPREIALPALGRANATDAGDPIAAARTATNALCAFGGSAMVIDTESGCVRLGLAREPAVAMNVDNIALDDLTAEGIAKAVRAGAVAR